MALLVFSRSGSGNDAIPVHWTVSDECCGSGANIMDSFLRHVLQFYQCKYIFESSFDYFNHVGGVVTW